MRRISCPRSLRSPSNSCRDVDLTTAIVDRRTSIYNPESGSRSRYDRTKRKCGFTLHLAVDTHGHLLAFHVTSVSVDDRAAIARLAEGLQEVTDDSVILVYDYQG